jgi:hypothetical protein
MLKAQSKTFNGDAGFSVFSDRNEQNVLYVQ